jgi:hypothetical protein
MDYLPWKTFHRIVERHDGDCRVRTLSCAEHFRILAFAQLTYRESLRDIETCLSAQAHKLYHMGIREPVSRSTLADANANRDWRIYAEFAQRLVHHARRLYADEALGLELSNTVYALDSTTIDLCLSMFPWADFRSTKPVLSEVEGWIKQHLRIKRFYGTSENAVKSQIWIAVSVYVLVAIIKKRLNLDASLYTLLQVLSVTLFEKIPLNQALQVRDYKLDRHHDYKQLNLFDY